MKESTTDQQMNLSPRQFLQHCTQVVVLCRKKGILEPKFCSSILEFKLPIGTSKLILHSDLAHPPFFQTSLINPQRNSFQDASLLIQQSIVHSFFIQDMSKQSISEFYYLSSLPKSSLCPLHEDILSISHSSYKFVRRCFFTTLDIQLLKGQSIFAMLFTYFYAFCEPSPSHVAGPVLIQNIPTLQRLEVWINFFFNQNFKQCCLTLPD